MILDVVGNPKRFSSYYFTIYGLRYYGWHYLHLFTLQQSNRACWKIQIAELFPISTSMFVDFPCFFHIFPSLCLIARWFPLCLKSRADEISTCDLVGTAACVDLSAFGEIYLEVSQTGPSGGTVCIV